MKTKLIFFCTAVLALLAVFCVPALAQVPDSGIDVTSTTTVADLLNYQVLVYSSVLTILSYLSKWIPIVNKIPGVALRVLVVAIIVAIVFKSLGLANGWQLVLGFIVSALFYDKVASPIVSTPKTAKDEKAA